ncbi:methyl-CpG-binding domain-containing protein 5 [Capsicum galapagoense]
MPNILPEFFVFLYMFCLNDFLPYYYEPVLATRFRSKPEVLYFLETGGKRKKSTGGDATPSETPVARNRRRAARRKKKRKLLSPLILRILQRALAGC